MATQFKNFKINKQKALTAGTLVMHEAISEESPVETGTLRRRWIWRIEEFRGIVGTDVPYAAIQNFGGIIRARNAEYLTFKIKGKWVKVKAVQIPAQRYIEKALTKRKDDIMKAVMDNLYD